jgi:hypothetical protein
VPVSIWVINLVVLTAVLSIQRKRLRRSFAPDPGAKVL